MGIVNQKDWDSWVESNEEDPYGKACVDVAREVMKMMDEGATIDPHKLICDANDKIKCGGITGFMAGCVAQMVSVCHSDGETFRQIWNGDVQIGDEGDKANEGGGVLNPALMTIDTGDK